MTDPLRPSARRLVHLFLGAAAVLAAFAIGFAAGLTPFYIRLYMRQQVINRALNQDPTLDFASPEWLAAHNDFSLPGIEALEDPPSVLLLFGLLLLFVLVALHILITRVAAVLAIRADRRLDLGLGPRPAKALAAMVIVRTLFTRLAPAAFACGLLAGVFHLGHIQLGTLAWYSLDWLPVAGAIAPLFLLPLIDLLASVTAVRAQLQRAAPVESRVCNACNYSLRGLPPDAESCPECGRALLDNRTTVSMLLSRRSARVARVGGLVLLSLIAIAAGVAFFEVAAARTVAAAWLTAKPVSAGGGAAGGMQFANILAPNGSIIIISDGNSRAILCARATPDPKAPYAAHARAIEPDANGTDTRTEQTQLDLYPTSNFLTRPATLAAVHAHDPGHYQAWLFARTTTLTVRFARPDELTDDERAWLTQAGNLDPAAPVTP